jgi:hypothetical protein
MSDFIEISLTMNPFLFGSLVLAAFWLLTLLALKSRKLKKDVKEFWWASFTCSWLGATEPLFVPEYWTPPSVLRVWRWDFESFLFCFAIGGIAAVLTELAPVMRMLKRLDSFLTLSARRVVRGKGTAFSTQGTDPEHVRIENMLLVAIFVGMFGATSQFGLNIIFDAAIVCLVTAIFVGWRRPGLRWQIFGGGVTFLLLYTVVLVVTGLVYPNFYDHWNIAALTDIWFLGAPLEEYMFAVTFGLIWAPLYEAWKDEPATAAARHRAQYDVGPSG